MTDIYQYDCKLCGNKQELDHEDSNWICMCKQRPQGSNWLHVCSQCNNHRWGSRNDVDCEVCFANKLTRKEHSVSVEYFGDMKNMPVRKSEEERMKTFDRTYEIFEEAKIKAIQNKIDVQNATLSIPDLLRDLNAKLDKVLNKQRANSITEVGYGIFGDKNVQ